jgi:LacI family gluconate utilization system Gnt-I transcriptional repressor
MLPPLTTVKTPRAEIGQVAAQMLIQLMHSETLEPTCIDVGYQLVVRGST